MKIKSSLVSKNFSKHASNYDENAHFQRFAADSLMDLCQMKLPTDFLPSRILEVGCGTGLVTEKIMVKFPSAEFLISDISEEMLGLCEEKSGKIRKDNGISAKFAVCDISKSVPAGNYDLVVSGLAFQWLENLKDTLDRIHAVASQGSFLVFTTLADKTFLSLRELFDRSGAGFPGPDFLSEKEILKACSSFETANGVSTSYPVSCDSALNFFRQLKKTGAINATGIMTPPAKLKKILAMANSGIETEYHLFSCICKK